MKRTIGLVMALALACSVTAFAEETKDYGEFNDNVEISIALHTSDGIHDEAIKQFKEKIEEKSGGAISVLIYENGTLGTEAENVTQLSSGEIECAVLSMLYSGNILEDWDAPGIPFLFESLQDVEDFWLANWDAMQEESIEKSNIRMIKLLTRGSRCLSADHEISDPSQLNGFKLRLPETTSWLTVWKSLGTNCTAINWNETYTALQNGVVDGQENPAATAFNANIQEVNSYMMRTNHVYQYFYWCFNEDFWQSLPDNYRELILDVADECADYCSEIAEEKTAEAEQGLIDGGMTIVDVDFDVWQEAAREGILEAAEPLNDIAKEYVNTLLED